MNHLAIIIPYYKLKYFDACLNSLSEQTDKRFSVYIGDDKSPENLEKILSQYTGKFDFNYHRFDKNLGGTHLTKQWERCIQLSKDEDWIMILGDDDVLENNFVESFYKNVEEAIKKGIKVIRFASQIIDENGRLISEIYTHPKIEDAKTSHMKVITGKCRSTLTEHIFTRKTFEKQGFKDFPAAFGSDNVAWLEFPEFGNILTVNESKAFIRVSPDHISSANDTKIRDLRRQGIYQFKRFIISKYAHHFSLDEREIILKRAYKDLRYSRNNWETLNFIWFMLRKLKPSQVVRIMRENRN